MSQVNVITVLYNNASTLEGYLRGLEAQGDVIARVILVDNASTDNTASHALDLLRGFQLDATVVRNSNAGFAGGYARGGKEVMDGSLPTLCLNPDVELASGAVERMLTVLRTADRVGIATAPLVTDTGEPDSASRRVLPGLGKAAVYAVLGKLTPRSLRYNRQQATDSSAAASFAVAGTDLTVTPIEATTGALMLVHPEFRQAGLGIFDQDYWMYGEDLQICLDAGREGWKVLMVEGDASIHLKGISSGRPRGEVSNIAFHKAMYIYYAKNLNVHRAGKLFVGGGIYGRLALQLAYSRLVRAVRKPTGTSTIKLDTKAKQ